MKGARARDLDGPEPEAVGVEARLDAMDHVVALARVERAGKCSITRGSALIAAKGATVLLPPPPQHEAVRPQPGVPARVHAAYSQRKRRVAASGAATAHAASTAQARPGTSTPVAERCRGAASARAPLGRASATAAHGAGELVERDDHAGRAAAARGRGRWRRPGSRSALQRAGQAAGRGPRRRRCRARTAATNAGRARPTGPSRAPARRRHSTAICTSLDREDRPRSWRRAGGAGRAAWRRAA